MSTQRSKGQAVIYDDKTKTHRLAEFALEIDWDSLLTQLGGKASRSKSKKATALAKAIVVKFKHFKYEGGKP